jgi:hypothetical protein
MSDMNALIMTIYTMVMIFIIFHLAIFLVMFPLIYLVIIHLEQEVELDFLEKISLYWFFYRNRDTLADAIEAINKKESVAEQVYELTDEDDDDDDGGIPIDQRFLAKT